MKTLVSALVGISVMVVSVEAQERLARPEALKYAFYAGLDLKQMTGTPIPTDPDLKRPVAIRHGDHGLLLLPEGKLKSSTLAAVGNEVVPIGQLWMVKIAPVVDKQPIPASKLRMIEVRPDGGQGTAACCALGVRKNSDNGFQLLIYGKEKEPLLAVPLKAISGKEDPEAPLDIEAEREEDSAKLTLKVLGKYEAVFQVGSSEQ